MKYFLMNLLKKNPEKLSINTKKYGKVYLPIYNLSAEFNNKAPELYNREGDKIKLFFLRDFHSAHEPYFFNSKYFLMDRFNFGLDTHFYTHNCMLDQMGKPKKRYGVLYESTSIVPEDYKIFDRNPSLYMDFDKIFTFSARILDKIPNAAFVPFQATPWYGRNPHEIIDEKNCYAKTKNISFLSSKKIMCDMHKQRVALANKCKTEKLADTYGTFDGGDPASLVSVLKDYRYTIIIENEIDDYYFTERLTNAFLSMTIPVYCGASKIGKFFNEDGIITLKLNDFDNIENILKNCNENDYNNRINAVIDNFNRVMKYKNVFDSMYLEYLK